MDNQDQVIPISIEIAEEIWKDIVISAYISGMTVIETVDGLKSMGIAIAPELVNDIFKTIEQTLIEIQDDPTMNVIH